MLPPSITRFQATSVVAAVLSLVAIAIGSMIFFLAVVIPYFVVLGLGVAIPQMRFFGLYVCRGNTGRKWVALTFDDGPDARSTPALLDLLRDAGVQATFFCIGKHVDAERDLTARIVREGHLTANHTYTHNNTTNFFTEPRLRDELFRTQAAIKEATGVEPIWFRPPVGLTNPRVFRAASWLKLGMIGWTVRSLDTKLTDPAQIVDRIVKRLKPGAIILLHDGNIPASRLVPTVKLLLDTLRSLGYEVTRLDHLLK